MGPPLREGLCCRDQWRGDRPRDVRQRARGRPGGGHRGGRRTHGARGVGRRLFARIREEARRDGVETLLCITLGENHRIRDTLRRAFPESRITFSGGACQIRLPLRHRESSWPDDPASKTCMRIGASNGQISGGATLRQAAFRDFESRAARQNALSRPAPVTGKEGGR